MDRNVGYVKFDKKRDYSKAVGVDNENKRFMTIGVDLFSVQANKESAIQASAAILFRSTLFWDVTERRVVIFTDVLGQSISSIFKGQEVFLDLCILCL
jgi:hypothetical protein